MRTRSIGSPVTGVLLLALALLAPGALQAAPSPSPVVGWIEIAPASQGKGHITVAGHVLGLVDASGRFRLAVKRAASGGVARTGQSGNFDVAAGQDVVLSRTTIDVAPAAAIEIELTLTVGGKEVFTAILKPVAAAVGREL